MPPAPAQRDAALSDDELSELLDSERVVVVSSLGPRGWPHSMPLWYVPRDGEELTLRYAEGLSAIEGDARTALQAQARKRVAIRFRALRTASWDHRKLGGSY